MGPHEASAPETLHCYRHPDRETLLSCSSCDRPICTSCMTQAAVGVRCPECAGRRTARVRAPHAGMSAATIAIEVKPAGDATPPRQQMRASLNGHAVGSPVTLEPGWQVVSFPVPANRWTYGFNLLTLEFSRTVPEPGTDRPLSAAIDRIRIR